MSADELEKIKQKLANDFMLVSALQNRIRDSEQSQSPNVQKVHEEKKHLKTYRTSEDESVQESTDIQSKGMTQSSRNIQNSYRAVPFSNIEQQTGVVKTKKTTYHTTMDVNLGSFPGIIQPASSAVQKRSLDQS